MYKLIIYWDDARVEVACEGTHAEVIEAMPKVAARINPDEATWAVEWHPVPYNLANVSQLVAAQMGAGNGHQA